MKSTILRSGIALACALGLAACGGGGDLILQGPVYGVTEAGLVLQNNGGHDTEVKPDASGLYSYFQFTDRISTDDSFNLTVKSVPSNVDHCEVANGSGHANYYTIQQVGVQCFPKMHKLTVTVNGLTTDGLQLVNGADKKTVQAGTTSVAMADVAQDASYGVTVLTQPNGQTCTVRGGGDANNGSGKVGAADITNVVVTCS